MEKIKRNFGFGCMRLPMQGEEVDLAQTKQMVDEFLAQGFNFSTPRTATSAAEAKRRSGPA